MRPRRLFLTAPRGKRERELPPATAARGTCSWPPGTSLPPSSPGRGERGDSSWLRMKLLLPTGRAWGSSPRFSPSCALHQHWVQIPHPPVVAQMPKVQALVRRPGEGERRGEKPQSSWDGVGGGSGPAPRAGLPAALRGSVPAISLPLAAEAQGSWRVQDLSGPPARARERVSTMHTQPCASQPGWTCRDPALGTDRATKTHRGCVRGFCLFSFELVPVSSRYMD